MATPSSPSWKSWSAGRMLVTIGAAAVVVWGGVLLLSGDFAGAWLAGCTAFVFGCMGASALGWTRPGA